MGINGANEETPQEGIVDGTGTIHLLGTEGTPENGSGEEGVDAGAGEPILLASRADVGDLGHLVVENGGANEGRHKGGDHLTVEGDPRWDVDVMRELEILGEVEGVRGRDVSVGLEVVHRGGVTGEPETSEQLGDDVQGNLDVRDGHDNTAGDTEDEGKEDTIQDDGRSGVGGVSTDTGSTQSDGGYKDGEVDVLGNLLVVPHETGVDILGVSEGGLAADQVLETGNDLTTVVEVGVGDGRGVDGEEHAVEECVSGGEVRRESKPCRQPRRRDRSRRRYSRPVASAGVVEHTVGVDGNVGGVPSVGVPDGEDDGEGEEGPEEGVEDAVEGIDEGVTATTHWFQSQVGKGVQSQTAVGTGDGGQVDVVGSDPGGPVEVGHGSDEVVGEPEVDEHGDEAVGEPPHPGHSPSVSGSVGSEWKALFSAMVAKLEGQMAREGYTRKRRVRPARP
jgi:hypothetical protein